MSLQILLDTLHRTKKELDPSALEVLTKSIASSFGQKGLQLLQEILNRLELVKNESIAPFKPIQPHHAANQYPSYNHAIYEIILPICQLAYLEEQNGLPLDHAFKLATLFSNIHDVIAYLARFKFTNS